MTTPGKPIKRTRIAKPGARKPSLRKTGTHGVGRTATGQEIAVLNEGGPRPRGRNNGSAAKHDWQGIRNDYLDASMDTTLKDIAEAHGVGYDVLRQRAAKERWTEQRVAHKAEVAKKHLAQRTEKMLKEAEHFDDDVLQAAQTGVRLVMARLAEIGNHFQVQNARQRAALEKLKQGVPVEREELYTAIRSTEMRELATALTMFQDAGRKALGVDILQADINVNGVVGDMEVNIVQVAAELNKDDPERLSRVFDVINRAGLQHIFNPEQVGAAGANGEDEDEDDDDLDDYKEVDEEQDVIRLDTNSAGVIEGSVVED